MSSGRLIGCEAPLSPSLAPSGDRKSLAADFEIVQIFPHSCGYADPASAHPNPPVASNLKARGAWCATGVLRICRTVPIEIWSRMLGRSSGPISAFLRMPKLGKCTAADFLGLEARRSLPWLDIFLEAMLDPFHEPIVCALPDVLVEYLDLDRSVVSRFVHSLPQLSQFDDTFSHHAAAHENAG